MHSADIRRSGGMLSVIVDGRVLNEIAVDRNRRFGLSLAVPAGEATLADLRLEEPRGNPLFNGRDFTGWWAPDKKGDWSVQDGQMVSGASHGNNYMRTDKQYANFNFAFEYKVVRRRQLRRGHSHGPGGLAVGRRNGAADPRPARRGEGLDDGHLRQSAAAGSRRQVGTVEPRGREGRRADDLGVGQWRTGAAGRHRRGCPS